MLGRERQPRFLILDHSLRQCRYSVSIELGHNIYTETSKEQRLALFGNIKGIASTKLDLVFEVETCKLKFKRHGKIDLENRLSESGRRNRIASSERSALDQG